MNLDLDTSLQHKIWRTNLLDLTFLNQQQIKVLFNTSKYTLSKVLL